MKFSEAQEKLVVEIIEECNAHNAAISDDEPRPPERVRRDAENIYMHRHSGITVETICMMLTDLEFALRESRG